MIYIDNTSPRFSMTFQVLRPSEFQFDLFENLGRDPDQEKCVANLQQNGEV